MSAPAAPRTLAVGVPSQDGLRLILAGVVYLLAICLVQAVAVLGALVPRSVALPSDVTGIRDVVALFGWVGLMISGVSVIIVPNHLRVRVRPSYLPTLHLLLANVGLAGFFAASWVVPGGRLADAFLGIISVSFFAFGVGVLRTVVPFLGRRGALPRAGAAALPQAGS